MTNEQVTSAADIDVTEIGHAEYHRVLDLLKNRESELEAIKLKYNDTEAKYDELLSEHEDLLRRFSDSTQDAPLLDRTQSDAAGGPDSALTQYVTRKQKEIETVLREGNTDSARAIRDSNRQRDIENIVSDIRSALKAVPQDYTTSDSFLNASEVGNTLGTSVLMQKHENLHALVRLIVSLGSFAPGGELIPHVPARCIPLKSIQDSVQNVMNLQTARSEFQRALDDAMYQYDHVTTYTERVNTLQSTIQMIDEQETNHDTAVQPMKDLCFQMIESIAEARHVETETTENIALISLRFERVKDDITRRTQSLEKDVTLREQVMQQEKSRITDLTQQIQSALQQLSDIFAWLAKEAVQHRELRNEVANYYALNEALVTCREHDEERMKSIREGAKTSTMLCCKVHEMIQREIDLCEELRRDQMSTLEKARKVTQERLYSTCQQQFSELRERVAEQRAALRKEQATLASAKRLVQTDIFPEQLGRQMQEEVVERSEKSVHTLRNAIRSTENEIGKVKDLLVSAGITDFCSLDRDGKGSNFLEEYDAQCFHHEVNEKLNEATEKLKIASDHICQVADKEDVTMDAVLRWMQEGTVALVDVRTFYTTKCTSYSMKRLHITDDDVRSSCITKLKRYRRLISDAFNDIFMVNSASVHDLEGAVAGVIQQCDDVLTLISTSGYSRAPGGTMRPSQDSFGLHDATSAGEIPSHTYRNLISTSFETPEKAYISSTSNNNNNNNIINDNGGYGSQVPPLALEYATTRADLNQNRTKNISQVSNSTKDTLGTFEAIVIGKASSKLMISHHGRRVRKGIQNMEVSDSTALGAVGYSRGKHQWRVRLRMACDKLMIGVADGSIPVEGYCNSLRYKNCFYLHVGSGTLWSPLMNMQRVPYVNESRLFVPGTELIVQLDIENGEISFGRDDTMFPAAFQGIQLAPGEKLFPSFEVYSNGCEFELIE